MSMLQKLLVAEHPTVTFAEALKMARTVGLPSHPSHTAETELRALLRLLHQWLRVLQRELPPLVKL